MMKHHFFIRNMLDRPMVKLFLYIFLFLALGITSLYFQSMFFPDFSWISIAHCVDANHLAQSTITSNPIEMHFMAGSDAISMASISNSSTVYEPTPEPSLLEQGGVIQEEEEPRSNFYYVCPTVTLYIGAGIAVICWTTFILHLLGVS